jgi:hypothetical protein
MKIMRIFFLVLISLPVIPMSQAHHAFQGEFDVNRPVELRGEVVRIRWINPHSWLYMDVTNEDGSVTQWAVEMGTPNTLIRSGISRDSIPAGTEIVVQGYQARNNTPQANGQNVTLADGTKLFLSNRGAALPPEE